MLLDVYECECGGKYELNIFRLALRKEMKVAVVAVMMPWLSLHTTMSVEAPF